ncbi:MAG: 3-oxoacyl-[acyl-carrier-protein] reductase [Candidatus Eisenbacteria bacterium]|uniref:3-oxoacyl-[acyl-carrier-protein] reductase n=1 Tax=Eiseniibacteriota bacterium TaxID=2212470 RepID=A0A956LZE3_UNCEI|nr:3-oxoacyl-[acyl-carrier-protein] reductase [Candidatus Eisenbacteria bacterium]
MAPHSGRVALVTGGSRGIGRAIALALARGGADVALVDRSGPSDGPTVREVRDLGVRCQHFRCDVGSSEQVQGLAAAVTAELGAVSILVNNAGLTRDNLFLRLGDEEWDQVLAVNLKGAFHCAKAFSRGMLKARWGRILNITSVVGQMGNKGQSNYAASKAGLIGLTCSLARELAERSITVNAVAPGFIRTEMTAELPDAVQSDLLRQIPVGRFGEPEDVGEVVSFLASEEARYITGQVLRVDGGMLMG